MIIVDFQRGTDVGHYMLDMISKTLPIDPDLVRHLLWKKIGASRRRDMCFLYFWVW
jgi:hypothetical protein